MKVIQIIPFFLLCASLTNFAQAQQKIGYVSTEAVVGLLPVTRKANEELAEMQTKFLTQGQSIQDEMKAKYDDLLAKNESGQLSDNLKQLGQQEMAQLQQDLNAHNQQSQDTLVKRRNVLFKPILKQVNETIQKVAEAQGYDMVFEIQESGLVYGVPDYNLTKAVLLELGIDTDKLPKPAEE